METNKYITLVTDSTTEYILFDELHSRWGLVGLLPPLKQPILQKFQGKLGSIGYCVSLYDALPEDAKLKDLFSSCYIKRAFWLAYELSEHAGLENLSDFYITCDNEMRGRIEPYRVLCEFPESNIICSSDNSQLPIYMKKIAMLTYLASQTGYTHYVHLDTSICFPVPFNFCGEFVEHWKKTPDTFVFHDPWKPYTEIPFNHSQRVMGMLRGDEPQYFRLFHEITEFFGEKCCKYYKRHVQENNLGCIGWFYGIPRHQILSDNWTELLEFTKETKCTHLDEIFLKLYWYKYLAPETNYYNQINPVSKALMTIEMARESIRFKQKRFFLIPRRFKLNKVFQDFFVQHYERLNMESRYMQP